MDFNLANLSSREDSRQESDVEDPAWIMTVKGHPGGLSPTNIQEVLPSSNTSSPLSSEPPPPYNSVAASSLSSLSHSPPKENNGVLYRGEKTSSPVGFYMCYNDFVVWRICCNFMIIVLSTKGFY